MTTPADEEEERPRKRASLWREFERISRGVAHVAPTRREKINAAHRILGQTRADALAVREEWIEERETFAPGCAEFDFVEEEEDEWLRVPLPPPPLRPKDVRGVGPSLADIGVTVPRSTEPAPPLSPLLLKPVAVPAPRPRPRPRSDLDDIFS